MPVLFNMTWLSMRWLGTGAAVEHHDLVKVPDGHDGFYYAIFDQSRGDGGIWREFLSEAEALQRLQAWVHEERRPGYIPRSQITDVGRQWLEEQA